MIVTFLNINITNRVRFYQKLHYFFFISVVQLESECRSIFFVFIFCSFLRISCYVLLGRFLSGSFFVHLLHSLICFISNFCFEPFLLSREKKKSNMLKLRSNINWLAILENSFDDYVTRGFQ